MFVCMPQYPGEDTTTPGAGNAAHAGGVVTETSEASVNETSINGVTDAHTGSGGVWRHDCARTVNSQSCYMHFKYYCFQSLLLYCL
jgi:hypothetical protein